MTEHCGSLDGAVAIVTGSARNIGRSIAIRLACAGVAVVINARRSQAQAEAVAAAIRDSGGRALAYLADVTREDEVEEMVAFTLENFGRLDILVNNAAVRGDAPIGEISFDAWRKVTASILDGAFLCSRACEPHLDRHGQGTIVNITGVAAYAGIAQRAHVAAAKAGLGGLTRSLAAELAPRGITVNSVSPGNIGTERDYIPSHFLARPTPLGRAGTPEEVAEAVALLCGPQGRYTTGQTIHVNGGWWMG
ncbi:SDR family NAD(P)-dependent oxidoreductase [Marinobacterium aestuariivivens]|uniref:SDR family NAD(P)-dependent oxidoreductase n=1 Tax=Marinobacterium aestuariivivens TaxID=1698799 RepID=A0ABW2A9N5_9GAMM